MILRRNRVEFNVAGIEIENSTGADVHDNTATNNAGGILVFNLPGLQVFGERTRVYNNQSFENNTLNFAPAGNIVAGVPTGTGIMILANDQIEVFGNSLRDNNSSQITLISYQCRDYAIRATTRCRATSRVRQQVREATADARLPGRRHPGQGAGRLAAAGGLGRVDRLVAARARRRLRRSA